MLGMPFMAKVNVALDPAKATASFEGHGTTIQCSLTRQEITASAATTIELLADKVSEYYGLTSKHERLEEIRTAITQTLL